MAKSHKGVDKEVELYRSILETPDEFREGFGWTTVAGIIFCGLVMLPGGIYLGLMTGYGLGRASSWVTVILFMEIARRALRPLSKQNLVILLHAAHVMMVGSIFIPGGPLGWMVYRAYFVGSEAVRDAGMLGAFPSWFAPSPDSPAILERQLFHPDWVTPIGIALFVMVLTTLQRYTLGYFLFRLTSDVERLPFPLAPIRAQGAMALAESEPTEQPGDKAPGSGSRLRKKRRKPKSPRWRIFSLGAYIGIAYGVFQVGVPVITGLFLAQPVYLIPQPFLDTTTLTDSLLPATPTGIVIDIGIIFLGFVLPFWSVMGTLIAIAATLLLNPVLHHYGILKLWGPGMDTVNTTFSNNIDFWLSFNLGAGIGIACICLFSTIRDLRVKYREIREARKLRQKQAASIWNTPEGRGDYPLWAAAALYFVSAAAMVALGWLLLPKEYSILFFLIFFAFLYNPFISYVNARLLGISGQEVELPHLKEAAFLLSGAKGVEVWLAPVPVDNFGGDMAQSFRVNELTGTSMWSLVKTDLVALPTLFVLSLVFWAFIWKANAVPSEMFPTAQVRWELMSKNQVLLYSSTFVAPGADSESVSIMDSEFMKAIHPWTIGVSGAAVIVVYVFLSAFGLPIMLIYGMIRGFGDIPHFMVLEVVGAFIGRFYFQKKYGPKKFLQLAPALLAGYFTGVGLVGITTTALQLIKSAISAAPF